MSHVVTTRRSKAEQREAFAHHLKAKREALNLSQAQFAHVLGVHWVTISKWERELADPTPHQRALVAEFRAPRGVFGNRLAELANLIDNGQEIEALRILLGPERGIDNLVGALAKLVARNGDL